MQMITFLVLAADSSHWSGQLLADTALLLTTSQGPHSTLQTAAVQSYPHLLHVLLFNVSDSVESAGVPSGLQSLAAAIRQVCTVLYCTVLYCTVLCCTVPVTILQVPGWAESFLRRDPAPAAAWLAATLPTELATFTNNFGHRCLKVMIMHYIALCCAKRAFKVGDSI